MRDRLIELIRRGMSEHEVTIENYVIPTSDYLADYLLENGVIVPPCKVGQILYVIESGLIFERKVKEYKYCSNSTNGIHWHIIFEELFVMSEAHFGKTVFLTKGEAEAKLKGGAEE